MATDPEVPKALRRAVEHGGYLADAVQRLLEAIETEDVACLALDNKDAASVEAVERTLQEAMDERCSQVVVVQSRLFEFRRRVERAKKP